MHTFSCGAQTVNIDDHIVARFDADPDDYSICRLMVWHSGGEATVTRFARNGLVMDTAIIPPPEEPATAGVAAQTSAGPKDPHDPNADKKGKTK